MGYSDFEFKTPLSEVYKGITPGTVISSKAVITDANNKLDTLDITAPKINGVSITATGAEINAINGIGTTNIKVSSHTITSEEATAGTVSIATGVTIAGFICTILRVGKDFTNKAAISSSTTNLVVATNGTDYVLTEDDVIQAIVWA